MVKFELSLLGLARWTAAHPVFSPTRVVRFFGEDTISSEHQVVKMALSKLKSRKTKLGNTHSIQLPIQNSKKLTETNTWHLAYGVRLYTNGPDKTGLFHALIYQQGIPAALRTKTALFRTATSILILQEAVSANRHFQRSFLGRSSCHYCPVVSAFSRRDGRDVNYNPDNSAEDGD
ncbi:hypothetical protein AAG570_012517 [Ranatra chinensis]|uniref:Uncharacterized protein n=1 Tax=Ranatra chinensis TaxID=642074 RepID=A0ABD0YE90_9HEMI